MSLLVLILASLSAGPVRADDAYADLVPCRATAMNAAGTDRPCITCHTEADGVGCASPPCLNPFGMAFSANGNVWDDVLAAMDSDGDGFTNGRELGDPLGLWRPAMEFPGTCSCASRPGDATFTSSDTDADMDGYCCLGRDYNDNGNCNDAGENDGSFDCDDTNATVFSGAAELCTDTIDNDCDGLPTRLDTECAAVFDADGDGVCPIGQDDDGDGDCLSAGESTAAVDCDDTDPAVSSAADEICTSAIDEDCDGISGLDDPDCASFHDYDGDRYCPTGFDTNLDGTCVGPGEEGTERDCDDTDPAINPLAEEICDDTIDNDCNGAADARDPDSDCRCDSSAQCDDGDPCTDDACTSMRCAYSTAPVCIDAGIADAGPPDGGPGPPDAGGARDAGTRDSGRPSGSDGGVRADAGSSGSDDDGGCGCRTAATRNRLAWPFGLVVGIALVARTRRRRGAIAVAGPRRR